MKPDSERKKFYSARIHELKSRMHVHLSKELRKKIKQKKRAVGVRKGDTVRIMRGQNSGKEAKVSAVSVKAMSITLDGITRRNARGKELPLKFHPSNLMLVSLEPTKERKELFVPEAFKVEKPKTEAKADVKKEEAKMMKKEEKPKTETPKAEKGEMKKPELK
jgi:large subunit ribosomal protein L24